MIQYIHIVMNMSKKFHHVRIFLKSPPQRLEVIAVLILSLVFSLFVGAAAITQLQDIRARAQTVCGPMGCNNLQNPVNPVPTYACLGGQPCTSPNPNQNKYPVVNNQPVNQQPVNKNQQQIDNNPLPVNNQPNDNNGIIQLLLDLLKKLQDIISKLRG